jgi:hypothetical protein
LKKEKLDILLVFPETRFQIHCRSLAKGALKVAELHDRDGRPRFSPIGMARHVKGDGFLLVIKIQEGLVIEVFIIGGVFVFLAVKDEETEGGYNKGIKKVPEKTGLKGKRGLSAENFFEVIHGETPDL